MRIRFKKTIWVDLHKVKLDETWDKQFKCWDELNVDNIHYDKRSAVITTYDGDLFETSIDTFEVVEPTRSA